MGRPVFSIPEDISLLLFMERCSENSTHKYLDLVSRIEMNKMAVLWVIFPLHLLEIFALEVVFIDIVYEVGRDDFGVV